MVDVFTSEAGLPPNGPGVVGGFVTFQGERYYRITNLDAMAPFFMSLVSDADHWLFISSNGALTAGRRHPDEALFPYHADDRIHDSGEHTGSKTLLRISRNGQTQLWEPFSIRQEGRYALTRNLYKSVFGNRILFEEVNHDLGATFRQAWMNSQRFGFVRRSELVNDGPDAVEVALVDGLQNVLPHGLGWRFQLEYSTLGDGYKRTECLPDSGLALFRLSSLPVDRAEPSEALRVNVAWSTGLDRPVILLSSLQLGAFRRGELLQPESDVRGRRGAYLLHAGFSLLPGAARTWYIAADVGKDAAGVTELHQRVVGATDLVEALEADIRKGTDNLIRLVAGADGLQASADELCTTRHFSNTLFNIMRGGIPALGYQVPTADFQAFLQLSNAEVAASYDDFLASLPATMPHAVFLDRMAACDDPDLERLAREYLPLTFSRRHGDPSRPWNIFTIHVRHEDGSQVFNYQGNWRDLFQNWEALAFSFPGYLEGMIFKFLDASTADGHNPYRVMKEGFEWETVDAHDPWSYIGYWGDHQVIYLLKLLEASRNYHPGGLERLLNRRVFTFANVPYRLKAYDEMLADPRNTIRFDADAHSLAMARVAQLGADGRLLLGPQGPLRATLADKLLLVALTKLANFIPGAGIWMNTQRPEWNDANNALVGYGVSVVTLCYLRRYLEFLEDLLAAQGSTPLDLSTELADFFEAVSGVLGDVSAMEAALASDAGRKRALDALGEAATRYRDRLYGKGLSGLRSALPADQVRQFCRTARTQVDLAIRANRREDGLYHAYNLMNVTEQGIQVRRLYKMLEGQVAVLSAGLLSGEEAADLLDALRRSDLYRADLGSYLLYPDRRLPRFLEKNRVPERALEQIPLLKALLQDGNHRLVARDAEGTLRFHAAFRSRTDLQEALDDLGRSKYRVQVERDGPQVLALYEAVFDHQSFTGRSGTFFKYEGLGCVYWHMVSKLLLAVDEVLRSARREAPEVRSRLERHHRDIRAGLGVHKSPVAYGAIPTDPYSHTPSFAGAQQPGMTGQVKEDVLTRFSELGVRVADGCLAFEPSAIPNREFLDRPSTFRYVEVEGRPATLPLETGSLAFTVCQVPVVLHQGGRPSIRIQPRAGEPVIVEGLCLDRELSAAVFGRTGDLRRLDVFLGLSEPAGAA